MVSGLGARVGAMHATRGTKRGKGTRPALGATGAEVDREEWQVGEALAVIPCLWGVRVVGWHGAEIRVSGKAGVRRRGAEAGEGAGEASRGTRRPGPIALIEPAGKAPLVSGSR